MIDLLLRGGVVHDGLGREPRAADVAVRGDRVVAVGQNLGDASRVIDVDGLAVAPGFIDPHSHSDMVPLMEDPQPFKLLQGVTTEIVGNCGYSFAPLSDESAAEARLSFGDLAAGAGITPGSFGDFLDRIEKAGPTNNVTALVGHNTLRLTANGSRATIDDEALDEMCRLADESFAHGAVGLSTGLIYIPGTYSEQDEVVALARVARRWGRPYTTHMRDEGLALEDALDEAIDIGRRAGVRVQISHCKAAGKASFGKSRMLLDKLHAARIEGIDVRGDQYPYLAGGTFLNALFPAEAREGGIAEFRRRLRDPDEVARLRARAEQAADETAGLWAQSTPDGILVIRHTDTEVQGKTIAAIAGARDPWDAVVGLVEADPNAMMVITIMDEADVRAIMADPLISIGSDNGMPVGLDHPRTWGCFPRFLGRYVRELNVVTWPEAVRKMTSATAMQFGLSDRGWLGPGAIADIAVFDPATVDHAGTYEQPDPAPTGIPYVVLGGDVVVDDGRFTAAHSGRVLRPSV
ncbi:MAG TPA: D-aminoacylase [Actinomycetota bacterium]|nr:D-aminoacylase [Actinomycetota bacterium]